MQDCIDGIMPLLFSEIDDNTVECDGKPLFFRFAEPLESIEEKLKQLGTEIFDFVEVEKGDESAIDNLIDSMPDNNIDDVDF